MHRSSAPVSNDRGLSGRPFARKSGSQWTLCRKEQDSNHRLRGGRARRFDTLKGLWGGELHSAAAGFGGSSDSPLKGTGFEPSVPRQEKWSMPSSSDQTRVGRTLTLGGGAESSLEGRDIELSASPKDIRTSPYDLCAKRSDRQSRGDRWFESTSLQQRVSLSRDFIVVGQEPRHSPRVCRAAFPARSAETRGGRRHAPTRGNISLRRYSKTAFPAMRSRQAVGLKPRDCPQRDRASSGL